MGPTPLGWLVRLDRVLGLEAVIVAFLQNPLMQQLILPLRTHAPYSLLGEKVSLCNRTGNPLPANERPRKDKLMHVLLNAGAKPDCDMQSR